MSQSLAFPASQATQRGVLVTTYSTLGGVGVGRLIDGVVYQSAGNGWYYPKADLERYAADNGQGYREALRGLCGRQS